MSLIISKMIFLSLLIFIGFVANKCGVLNEHSNKTFSNSVIKITLPCMMLASLNSSKATPREILIMFFLSFLFYGVFMILGIFIPGFFAKDRTEIPLFRLFTVFTNNGYMGFPVIQTLYGSSALVYAAIVNIPMNILMFTYGIYYFQKEFQKTEEPFSLKIFLNVPVISVILTMILAMTGFKFQGLFQETLSTVGNMTVPLSMMLVGSSLSYQPILEIFQGKKVYIFSALRLLVFPAFIWLLFLPLPINTLTKNILIVMAGMPCAANSVVIAEQYDADVGLASKYIFVTTLISIITIPMLSYFLLS